MRNRWSKSRWSKEQPVYSDTVEPRLEGVRILEQGD